MQTAEGLKSKAEVSPEDALLPQDSNLETPPEFQADWPALQILDSGLQHQLLPDFLASQLTRPLSQVNQSP